MNRSSSAEYILALDLGVSSIGFALVRSENDKPQEIIRLGVRIIPLSKDDQTEFTQGNAISKNRDRTLKRTYRKGLDRYQLRRKALTQLLKECDMMPDKHLLLKLSPLEIWGLRAKAVTEKISLPELGRILLHLNQRRGYRSSKSDAADDTKQTEYIQKVNERFSIIKERGETIGQHFYNELKNYFAVEHRTNAAYRIKEKVFPREAYIEEFDAIWQRQQPEYPAILTTSLCDQIRNEIIYYQRRLKSQKGLVNFCKFESARYTTAAGKEIMAGPKVAPRSSPLFQVEKIWESINNIIIKNKKGETFEVTEENRKSIFDHLTYHERLTQADLFKIIGIGRTDGFFTNELIRKKGLQGNLTRIEFAKVLGDNHPALAFNLSEIYTHVVDKTTGEVLGKKTIDPCFEQEPLYKLWHYIYSLDETNGCNKLTREFGFDTSTARQLAAIDLTKGGFGNKSAKAIRKILPGLIDGYTYDKACDLAGYNHSSSLTREENLSRDLLSKLSPIKKNSLRQPIVEKILNQLVNLVNTIIDEYGPPNSIRVELARELRQSREERNDTFNNINKQERENKKITEELLQHDFFRKKKGVTRRDIDRYRLWKEFGGISPYEPAKTISLTDLFSGDYDIEHILPRALRFDDSFSNKTICNRRFNSGENAKNRTTAHDYMLSKRSRADFESFLSLIESAYRERRISRKKYENLLMTEPNIPSDFINRQLNETRYITRKAIEILNTVCHNVSTTTGSITQRLRNLWGWDEVLEQLNFPKYASANLTEDKEVSSNGKVRTYKAIKNWSKRDDHRHHAIDALVVACTNQKFILRINTLNAQHTREEMLSEIDGVRYKEKLSLLDKYLLLFKPFSTDAIANHCEGINISYKPGKKVATFSSRKVKKGKRKEVVQKNIIAPRGPLSEESVYGKIKRKVVRSVKLNKSFSAADRIIDEKTKVIVMERLLLRDNNTARAFGNLKSDPIWSDEAKTSAITQVNIWDYEEEFVIKYDIQSLTAKDLNHVVDRRIREVLSERLKQFDNNHKEAFKNVVWLNEEKKIPIKRVRCFTGLKKDSMVPIRVKDDTWEIEYEKYVKPGNNHHIALYKDLDGKIREHVVTFWHAVERKKYGLPVVIREPRAVWNDILNHRALPEPFLANLPGDGWIFQTSMQQNESFVFNMSNEDLAEALKNKDYKTIAPNVFRVRKLSSGAYWFNQQFETMPKESVEDKKAGRCIQASLSSMNGIKIRVNLLGDVFIDR